ncbi:hypothetical protein [Paraglaciecola marina]|uniref:hypothetical protein n=1 Tax=Paraglaciecola marina TaxID=2500157 RepID=UPI00105E27C4|nr:hypothetical protein [Paraglaciecola marina]
MKALIVFMVLLVPFFAHSIDGIGNDNPSGSSGDELFDYDYGVAAGQSSSCTYNGQGATQYVTEYRSQVVSDKIATSNSSVKYVLESSGSSAVLEEFTDPDRCYASVDNATVRTSQYNCNSDQTDCGWSQNGSLISLGAIQVQGEYTLIDVCPPNGFSGANATYVIMANIGTDNYCFDASDINERDSCDDSDYGSDLIPVLSYTSTSVCKKEDDGSYCEYVMSTDGESYGSVPSGLCYVDSELEEYFNENLPTVDETGDECQDLGFGLPSCVEDPVNVCDSSGTCDEGCGNIETSTGSAFVCLSPDTDNDGLADYLDPDIDGDGIANDDDLDADGDGQDDPTYSGGSSAYASVYVDNSGVESRLDGLTESTNLDTLSTSTKSEIDAVGQSLETKVDEALADEKFNLAETLNENNYGDSLDSVISALTPSGCANSILIPNTSAQVDVCGAAEKVQPYLYWIFAVLTTLYAFYRVTGTLKGVD